MSGSHGAVAAVIILFAVLVFAVSHSVFFWFVASREVERTVERKSAMLTLLRRALDANGRSDTARQLDAYVARCAAAALPAVSPTAADDREAHNLRQIGIWIGPVLVVLATALIGVVAYNVRKGHRLTYAHWVGLLLALFGYAPELIVFWLSTDGYAVVGDGEIVTVAMGLAPPPPHSDALA